MSRFKFLQKQLKMNYRTFCTKIMKLDLNEPLITGFKYEPNYNKNNDLNKLESIQINKMDLINKYGFDLRDLRLLNAKGLMNSYEYASPCFFVRKKAFIIHFLELTAIISYNNCYLFNYQPNNGELISHKNMNNISNNNNNDNNNPIILNLIENLKKSYYNEKSSIMEVPFEFECLECVLKTIIALHREQLNILLNEYNQVKQQKLGFYDYDISMLKIKLSKQENKSKLECDSIKYLLNNDDDLMDMHLTYFKDINNNNNNIASNIFDHSKLEYLLENYLWQFEEINSSIHVILNEIMLYENNLKYNINKQRNDILKMNLKLSCLTCSISFGALFCGAYGMNLINYMESNNYAFYCIAPIFCIGFPMIMYSRFKKYLMNQNIII